jgi:hypothetical protein
LEQHESSRDHTDLPYRAIANCFGAVKWEDRYGFLKKHKSGDEFGKGFPGVS